MCLLFFKPASIKFTDAQLVDMYKRNSDGFGVMYAKDGMLHIDKGIGSAQDWIDFHRKHENFDACWHTRMRTHGDVDLENCHPYPVYGFEGDEYIIPVAMMHNGVLSMGNKGDPTKSDTWHYIRNIIRPLTKKDPDVIFSPEFASVIGDHISSSNKFAFMDHKGRVQIINKSAGIEWNECWFSNTYAWDARNELLYPGISKSHKYPTYNGYYSNGRYFGASAWDDYDSYYGGHGTASKGSAVISSKSASQDKLPAIGKKSKVHQLPRKTKPNAAVRSVTPKMPRSIVGDCKYSAWDIDYVIDTLNEDLPKAFTRITIPQIETLLAAYGPNRVSQLMEEAVFKEITEETLIELFRDQRKAGEHFAKKSHAVK